MSCIRNAPGRRPPVVGNTYKLFLVAYIFASVITFSCIRELLTCKCVHVHVSTGSVACVCSQTRYYLYEYVTSRPEPVNPSLCVSLPKIVDC